MPTASMPSSSSASAISRTSPFGTQPLRASTASATALAAVWPFMSSAPRPHRWPSRTSPANGGTLQSSGSA